ncbi:hypothetical protein UFOVP160_34 [uncultured Caudovirales phage]|uniref:Uncharacterized protein n=1 Tax=uncultured Caudovirales phage TaxID=2100421 RepID=A0A6J7WDI4_9CAUD|nr:hypothetical protein UFOVP160_34 [uncultured Caudovirales phage]
MTQEVLMLALDALDNLMYWDNGKPDYDDAREAITAIKEALREHAMREVQRLGQEPVAYINVEKRRLEFAEPMAWHTPTTVNIPKIPLYTTPPQRTWVGLTGDDWKQITRKANYHWEMTTSEYAERIGELTESKLKELNT